MSKKPKETASKYPVRRFFATRSIGAYDLSPDGAEAAFVTNLTGSSELFKVPVQGGWPVQLTFDEQSISQVAYSPDDRWIAFLQDESGDENYQLYLLPRGGGNKELVTLYPQSRHIAFRWSANGKRLYYTANRRNPRVFDMYRYDLAAARETLVAPGPAEGDAVIAAVSDNEKEVFHVLNVNNLRHKLYRVDAQRRQVHEITPGKDAGSECTVLAPRWVQRERKLYFLTNFEADSNGIASIQFPSGRFDWLKRPGGCDVCDLAVSGDGRLIAYSQNNAGVIESCLLSGARLRKLTTQGIASRLSFSGNGRVLGSVRSSPTLPHDLFCLDLKTGKTHETTRARASAIPERHLGTPQLLHYASYDRRTVSAFLYLPRSGKPPYPTIVWPHGGPEAQEVAEYRPRHQFFANQGFAVFVPNFRGSTGFGKRFQRLVYRDWGGGHYRDVVWGVRHLIRKGLADPDRLGIYGGSFGGYTALWALTQDPDLWKAGVAVAAPANLVTLIENTHPAWRKAAIQLIGDPEADREFLRSRSPIEYVDTIRAPLLVIHGANDPRVKRSEADQLVQRLKSRGIPVEHRVFEGEGHGWRTLERTYEEIALALDFLNWHLKKPIMKERERVSAA